MWSAASKLMIKPILTQDLSVRVSIQTLASSVVICIYLCILFSFIFLLSGRHHLRQFEKNSYIKYIIQN